MSSASPASRPGLAGYPSDGRQRGAALVLALVVVMIVALLATSVGNDFLVVFRRVENQLYGKQADAYMRGAEGLARNAIQLDFQTGNKKDHASEGWLDTEQDFLLDYGAISGRICDLQGRFNLNNLLLDRPAGETGYSFNQALFIRLLQTLPLEQPLDQQMAEDITQALTDWLDSDSDISGTGGAENGYYMELETPYRAANQPLHSVSELRWVKGIDDQLFKALQPYVTVLATGTQLNVNTTALPILRSLNVADNLQPLFESDAEDIISERDGQQPNDSSIMKSGFDSVAAFFSSHPATDIAGHNLDVKSDHFLLASSAIFMERKYQLYSVIQRTGNGEIKILARANSGLGQCYDR